jgi:O-antigen ligase
LAYLGLLVYCFLLYIRPGDWVDAVLNWPLEYAVIVFTLVVAGIRQSVASGKDGGTSLPPQAFLLVLWVLAIFASNAVHGNFGEAQNFALDFVKRAVVFWMFVLVLDSTTKLRWMTTFLILLTAVLGVQGIYQKQYGIGWAGQSLYWGGRIDWIGMWDGANILSVLFVTAFPFVLEMFFGPWRLLAKMFAAVTGGLILNGMALAASRGAGIALMVVLLVYFRSRMKRTGAFVGAIAIVAFVAIAPPRFSHLDMGDDSIDASSSMKRIDMWAQGLEMLRYNPILGIGKGRFAEYTGSLIAHNVFVQNMGETGLIGLFIWVALVYTSFKTLLVVLHNTAVISTELASFSRSLFVSYTGYLAASFFISTDLEPFYILMALCLVTFNIARAESGRDLCVRYSMKDLANIVCLEIGGIITMYVITRTLSE